MSLTGLKKQFNKANQLISEKIGNSKGTELDSNYVEMEKNIDTCTRLFEEACNLTEHYLQPNPASRAMLMTRSALHRVQGKDTHTSYPQPESKLGDCLVKASSELQMMPSLAKVLHDTGDTFQALSDQKYSLEDNVKQNFLIPLAGMQTRTLKEIGQLRKKVQSRRLDYDCKKRQDKTGGESEDVRLAENKFKESREVAQEAMATFLDCEAEIVSALTGFIDATVEYHQHALDELKRLQSSVRERHKEADNKPRLSFKFNSNDIQVRTGRSSTSLQSEKSNEVPASSNSVAFDSATSLNTETPSSEPKLIRKEKIASGNFQKTPTCRALYDFKPENPQELGFNEGDIVHLISQLDENWYYGEVHGKQGHFPVGYVEVLVPL